MSSPTRNRPHKGRVSPRAIKTWKDAFNGFVHSAPDSNLQTENLPINPDRNPFSLAKVKHLPSVEDGCVDAFCGCQASDGQLSHEALRNYAVLVWNLAQKSDIQPVLIEHDTTL
jgi:hypothetical protein